ncbi:cytochrome P450 [Microdochium trichocladiopsis]|uniref:Cytochrome P450 n=1 Tax=Microdochium trichocladiopsis TaxID=1682393 RepID=A0A9P8XYL7_9PEZI|nr:cytochrome P450 [Microdochium trichocladiopsis]KAH7020933.1 cytochrome P450 [Microdochium trichocladiopsis]
MSASGLQAPPVLGRQRWVGPAESLEKLITPAVGHYNLDVTFGTQCHLPLPHKSETACVYGKPAHANRLVARQWWRSHTQRFSRAVPCCEHTRRMFIFALLEARFLAACLAASPFLLQLVLYPAVLSPSSRLILAFVQLYTTTACVAAVALLYKLLLYPFFLSPLSRLPQPHWSCSITSAWILWARFSGRENRTLQKLHRKYGPVVRIGPAEVSVNSLEAVKTVYQGGFDKHSWYDVFNNYGVPNTFSSTQSKHHSVRKRMVSNVYSKSYIATSPATHAQGNVIVNDRLMPLLQKSASQKQQPHGINVHSLFCAVAMDFITAYCFGISRSSNFIQDKNYRDHWLKLYMTRKGYGFFEQELPYLESLVRRTGFSLTPAWVRATNEELQGWCKSKSDAAVEYVHRTTGSSAPLDASNEPVVVRAMLAGIDREARNNGESSLIHSTAVQHPELSVASEVLDHVLAGQETTGVSLTYLSWHLSQSPDLQRELREELRSAFPSPFSVQLDGNGEDAKLHIPDAKRLDALPVLHAVIMETVRRYAPAGGPEPRVVPASSSVIAGQEIPGGTRISASAYNLHRDERAYPDPLKWDHTRWLRTVVGAEGDEGESAVANRHFWGFSSGGRMCLGSNFAMHEMKLVVAAIWANYVTHIVDDVGIEQTDAYTGHPRSNSLYLRFERVI